MMSSYFCAQFSITFSFFIFFNLFWSLFNKFQRRRGLKTCSQNFTSSFRNENCMLKLCRPLSINCSTGPFIIPSDIFPHSLIDHGLYCENVTLLHKSNCFVSSIMGNLRCLMEHSTDTMSRVCSDNGVAERLNCVCNYISALFIHVSWFAIINNILKTVVCAFNKGS